MQKLFLIILMVASIIIQTSQTPKDNKPQSSEQSNENSLFHDSRFEASDSSNNDPHANFKLVVFGGRNTYLTQCPDEERRRTPAEVQKEWDRIDPDRKLRAELAEFTKKLLSDLKSDTKEK